MQHIEYVGNLSDDNINAATNMIYAKFDISFNTHSSIGSGCASLVVFGDSNV